MKMRVADQLSCINNIKQVLCKNVEMDSRLINSE